MIVFLHPVIETGSKGNVTRVRQVIEQLEN